MDNLVPKAYKDYGLYINEYRSFPLLQDGLKPVERRILYSCYQIARDKFVKSVRVDGFVLGHFHPHSLSYGSIVQLVNQGFLEGQGSFGTNVGVEPCGPAASRYTECKLSKKTADMAFRLIDYVDMIESELDDEPEFIPTLFPFCLMGEKFTSGMGLGYSTLIPCYKIEDLYKRLLFLLKITDKEPIIKPISDCTILSSNDELKNLLVKGKQKIQVKSVYKIENERSRIIMKSKLPPGKTFISLLEQINKHFNQDIGFSDLSSTDTNIVFEVLRQRGKTDIFNAFIKFFDIQVTGNISFENNVFDRKISKVICVSVDDMLLNTYKYYSKINEKMLNESILKINEVMKELKILEIIRPSLATHVSKSTNAEETIEKIHQDTKIEKDIISKLLSKYRISKLLSLTTDTSELEKDQKDLQEKLNSIDKYVLGNYDEFMKTKY